MKSYAIILGGGSGRRMEADRNKVFLPLRGIPAIVRAIAPFSALCAGAVVVAAAAEVEEMRAVIARCGLDRFVMRVVPGGAERQDSVRCGLDALPDKLRETARLRAENPELTLAQLAALCDPPVTKSCLNHRLRKLMELARG